MLWCESLRLLDPPLLHTHTPASPHRDDDTGRCLHRVALLAAPPPPTCTPTHLRARIATTAHAVVCIESLFLQLRRLWLSSMMTMPKGMLARQSPGHSHGLEDGGAGSLAVGGAGVGSGEVPAAWLSGGQVGGAVRCRQLGCRGGRCGGTGESRPGGRRCIQKPVSGRVGAGENKREAREEQKQNGPKAPHIGPKRAVPRGLFKKAQTVRPSLAQRLVAEHVISSSDLGGGS